MYILGGSSIINQFLKSGLVNEIRLTIATFMIAGKSSPRFFYNGEISNKFKLIEVKELSGIAILRYKNL